MTENDQSPFKIIAVILIVLLVAGAGLFWYLDPLNMFSSKTILLGDRAQDWVSPDGSFGSNPDPYPVAAADLKAITLDIDNQNLYVKYQFRGSIPEDVGSLSYAGDHFKDYQFYLAIDRDNNASTGNPAYGGAEALLSGAMHGDNGTLDTTFWVNPGDDPASFQDAYAATMAEGGPGYDHVTMAYPLNLLGLSKGQIITLNGGILITSDKYGKAATADFLSNLDELTLGDKGGQFFRVKLGGGIVPLSSYEAPVKLN